MKSLRAHEESYHMMCVPYHSRALGFLSRILSAETDVPSLSLCHTVGSLSMSCLITLSSLSGPFLLHFFVFTPTLSLQPRFPLSLCLRRNPPLLQLGAVYSWTRRIHHSFFLISHTQEPWWAFLLRVILVVNHLGCLHFLRDV